MASTILPSFGTIHNNLLCRHKELVKYPQVRSHSFKDDEGKEANKVDSNLSVLRKRIEEVKKKERLFNTACRLENGWNYGSGYDCNHKRQAMLLEFIRLVGLVGGALSLVFLIGSLSICLFAFLYHL